MEIKPETIATERPLHLAGKSTHHNCAGVRCNIARLLCDGRGLRRKCLSTARPIAAETSGSLLLIPNLFVELHVRTAKLRANRRALANLSRDRMVPPSPIANGFVARSEKTSKEFSSSTERIEATLSQAPNSYDPTTGTWSDTGSFNTPRDSHTATLLPNGIVLVAGGREPYPASV